MSIHKILTPNGATRYQVRWRDPDHSQKAKNFRRKVDAKKFEDKNRQDLQDGSYIDPQSDQTLSEYVNSKWWPSVVNSHRAPATIAQYRSLLDKQILPHLGKKKLSRIRKVDVETWLGELRKSGLSGSTVSLSRKVLSMALESAIESKVTRENPAKGVVTRDSKPRTAALDVDQIDALIAAIPEHWKNLTTVLAYTGMRPGEALALRVGALDELGRLTIRESQSEVRGKIVWSDTKTHTSRTFKPPRRALEVLKTASEGKTKNDLLFISTNGGPVRLPGYRKIFKKAVEIAGLPPDTTPYTLRHSCASLLARAGVPIGAAATMLGHDKSMFLKVYSHLYPGDLETAADKLSDLIEAKAAPSVHVLLTSEKDATYKS